METWNLIVFLWFSVQFCDHCFVDGRVSEIKVRLVGGRSPFEGRVEVYYNATWGTVCDDKFGYLDAQVFCYMLGYERYGAQAKHRGYFGEGNKTIWLDDLHCNGTETSVEQCGKRHGRWGSHNCNPSEDAGIVCQPKVRLFGGRTKYEGRVEIHYLSIWGGICDDEFTNANAQVFCSMLGNERYGAQMLFGNNSNVNSSGNVLLDGIYCSGDETFISECNNTKWESNSCSSNTSVAIKCHPKYDIRLIGGLVEYEGRIEIFDSGDWRSVCSVRFTNEDAQVLCHMLGFPREDAVAYSNAYFGQGTGDTWIGNMGCDGHELSAVTCKNEISGFKNCTHSLDAGVRCKPNVRLVDGSLEHEGRVEVYHSGIWGTVCDDAFDSFDVQVLCAMLGYERNGSTVSYQHFPSGNGTIWLDDLRCLGDETRVDECDKSQVTWGSHNCGHNEDAGMICQPKSGCTALSMPAIGQYSNASCTSNTSKVGTHCTLLCPHGHKPFGEHMTTCSGTGLWSTSDIFMTCIDVDECKDGSHLCSQNCRNTNGSYDCYCNNGYARVKDNTTCNDINECEADNGGCSHTCTNRIGSYICSCLNGYFLKNDSISCLDVNECNIRNGDCSHICINEEGSYRCNCTSGYYMASDNLTCLDDNECNIDNGGCKQICVNKEGSYRCDCISGYNLTSDNQTCVDDNECNIDNGGCDQICENDVGSYRCYCNSGYNLTSDNLTCVDCNECNKDNGGCDQICVNEVGSYSCKCISGYNLTSDNLTCIDYNECNIENGGCDQICVNTDGKFYCKCNNGYLLDNDTSMCHDINECEIGSRICDHDCQNTNGSYFCSCMQGFRLLDDNLTCSDINECMDRNGGCDHECSNENGTFLCSCNLGYLLQIDNKSCDDINECNINNGGCEHVCINTKGAYECSCQTGFIIQNDSFTCEDTNECQLKNGGCEQMCVNTIGSFSCKCEAGYYLHRNNYSCNDVNECNSKNGNCEQICSNTQGSFSCGCKDGFILDMQGFTCEDIVECDTDNGGCQQLCHNLVGSFACGCENGYVLNKNELICDNVSERSQSSSLLVNIGERMVKNMKDPATYNFAREQLETSLQKYFKEYTALQVSIAVQEIRTFGELMETGVEDNIIVSFIVIYGKETTLLERDNILRGILDFNKPKQLLLGDERVQVFLMNEAPVISPSEMLVNLSENASVGTLIGVFTVRDNDKDVRGNITIYSYDKPEEIRIGQVVDDKIHIILADSIDADKFKRSVDSKNGPVINFTIVVKDKPGSKATANVSLVIYDINDIAPVCKPEKLTVQIPRDETVGTGVYNLNKACIDNDYFFNRIKFVIEDDTCKAFAINSSGELFLKSAILEKHPNCMVIFKVTDQNKIQFQTKLFVLIKFQECLADVDYRNKEWKRGSPGKYTFSVCPEGYKGEVKRFCNLNAEYLDPIYNCTNAAISKLMEKVFKEETNVSSVLTELANVTAPPANSNNSLMIGDLETVNKVMSKITEVIEVNADNVNSVADFYVETANNILDESTTTSWSSKINETGSGADSVLENLDRFTEKISNVSSTAGEIKVAKSNLFLKVGSTNACKGVQMQFPNRSDTDVPKWAGKSSDRIIIACSNNSETKSYSSVMYRNLSKILPTTLVGNSSSNRDEQLNAPVMSFSYFPSLEGKLEEPIEITFQMYNGFLEGPLCSFWEKGKGGWSTVGCWLVKFNKKMKTVVCRCNHLTNFAVLMSPASAMIDHPALSTISLVGCILSMICLFITIVVHAYFWRALKSDKAVMNLNLACVLFVAYIIFLSGVNQTENKGACTFIAVLLHLAYLIVFFIMLSEGLLLAKTILYPLNTRKPVIPLLIISYVTPAIIVAISMGSVALDGYGDEKSCWLSADSGLIWAFLVPALIIVLINTSIITMVIKTMFRTSIMAKKSRKEKAVTGARSIAILMPIMGITWVLGVFSVNEDTAVFQYLFALFNSTQGVLIFVFHCAMNKKVRKAIKKQKTKWMSLRSYSVEKSTSSSMKSRGLTEDATSIM